MCLPPSLSFSQDFATLIISSATNHSVVAHDPALQPASDAFALAFLLLVLFLTLAVAAFALVLRHRARHPQPEAEWIEALSHEPAPARDRGEVPPTLEAWERSSDWWKDNSK